MKIQTLLFFVIAAFIFVSCQNQPKEVADNTPEVSEKINVENIKPESKEGPQVKEETNVEDEEITEAKNETNEEAPKAVKVSEEKPVDEKPETKSTKEEVKTASTPTTKPADAPKPAEVTTPEAPTKPADVSEPKPVEETKPAPETPVVEKPKEEKPPAPPAFSHDIWDGLTRKYVSSTGKVNYAGFKKDIAQLDAYIALLKDNPPSGSRSAQLAYWINVYNAYTVKLIADNYPVSSITKLHGGKPWNVRWVEVNGKKYTLDEVENSVIRPKFKDARIHFAVNCAAKSCPPLLNRAWTESNLERYLESQTKKFINNTAFNQLTGNSAKLSKIFEWYAVDFDDLITYINKYSDVKVKPGSNVTYNEYDWGLNN